MRTFGTTERFGFSPMPVATQLQPTKEDLSMAIWGMPDLDNISIPEINPEKEIDVDSQEAQTYFDKMNNLKNVAIQAKMSGIDLNNPRDENSKQLSQMFYSELYDNIERGKLLNQSLTNKKLYSEMLNDPNVLVNPIPSGKPLTNDILANSVIKVNPQPLQQIAQAYKQRELLFDQNNLDDALVEYEGALSAIDKWAQSLPPQFQEQAMSQYAIPFKNAIKNPMLDNYKIQKVKMQEEKQAFDQYAKNKQLAISQQNADNAKERNDIMAASKGQMTDDSYNNYLEFINDVKAGNQGAKSLLLNGKVDVQYEDDNGKLQNFKGNISKVNTLPDGSLGVYYKHNGKDVLVKAVKPDDNSEMMSLFMSAGGKYIPVKPQNIQTKPPVKKTQSEQGNKNTGANINSFFLK